MAGLVTRTIKRFRGMRSWLTRTQLTPEFAESCLNVVVSESGGLEKFRAPVPFTALISNIGPVPIFPFVDFQQGTGTRQILGVMGSKIVRWDQGLIPLIVDDNIANTAAPFDCNELNNILFMFNGQRQLKWLVKSDGTGVIQNAGIATPISAPTIAVMGGVIDTLANSGAVRAANVVTIKFTAPHNIPADVVNVGSFLGGPIQIIIAGVSVGALSFNGQFVIIDVPTPSTLTYAQIGANETQGGGTGGIFANITFSQGGRSIRYSYGNSVTGHEGSMSPASPYTGNITVGTAILVTIPTPVPPDPQIDIAFIYVTQDGGGDYFLEQSTANSTGFKLNPNAITHFIDGTPDSNLLLNIRGSLINNPPPVAPVGMSCYTTKFGGRLFLAIGQTIYYTGYEQIRRGRPEESYPPFNRLLLATGADRIRAIGVIQAGVVAWSKSNEMFMFKGIVEDITTDQPVIFTAFLEQLPWNEGALSHYTVQSTAYGVIWLAADHTIKLFDGGNKPRDLSPGIYPLLRNITQGREESCVSVYYNYCERDWYVMIAPLYGATQPNYIIFIDMRADDNFGIFIAQFPCDDIAVIEDQSSLRRLCISNAGQIFELISARATATGGIDLVPPPPTSAILPGFWRGGYFGNDTPQLSQTWRYARLVTDLDHNTGFGMEVRTYDDTNYPLQRPLVQTPVVTDDGKYVINQTAKRCQIEIRFPDQDMSANVLELQVTSIPGSER